jgi:2-polyprenyl-3-methyl-5-hydroxy-6-metoxy-1,4-benzoquinol methylase
MANTTKDINDVKRFWEANPLFAGESSFQVGSKEYFEEHRLVYIEDCFAGQIDSRIFPEFANCDNVLDLDCGPGFWAVELSQNGAKQITAADLTEKAIKLLK